MSQYFKITYKRKQVTTDYLGGVPIKEVTTEISEVVGGLPSSTVANYRRVLGDQVVSVEPDDSYGQSEPMPRGGVKRDTRAAKRSVTSRKTMGPAAAVTEDDAALTGSYASLVSKMAEKEAAA